MSEADEFDPSAAAAAATGDLADADPDDLEDAPAETDQEDVDDQDGDSSTGGDNAVAVFLLPLITASDAGPSASTLREHGIGGWVSHVVDGAVDYLLHFTDSLGDELDDSLGPAGKIGRGIYQRFGDQEDSADQEGHEQSADDDRADVADGGL